MFIKKTSDLTYADIDDLVNIRKEREGYHLDFKEDIGNPDKAKKEIAKDISAFANSYGGHLIFGVDKAYNITGIDPTIQNKSVDEWINQVLQSNIESQLFYHDPKIIEIPGSDKIVLVIQVPESTKKPHIVTEWNKYHIRVNDSSKAATHGQIRDMFEFSKNRTDEFNSFLQKRNLLNEDSQDFGQNKNSSLLYSDIPLDLKWPLPLILFSVVPKYPNEEKLDMPFSELQRWLIANASGYPPYSSMRLYFANDDYDLKLDGVVFKKEKNNMGVTSYFEILNNGFIEAGLSSSVTHTYQNRHKENATEVAIYLTQIVMYEMLLLGFAKKFYSLIKYTDEFLLQVSFVNVLNFRLFGFNEKYSDTSRYISSNTANTQHPNFKITYTINPADLSEATILSIAKHHSEKICRAFGLPRDYAFVDDKLSISQMNDFYL